jgi:3-oxoacyl-[acyl-carrier-protein] synthase-3
MAIIKFNNVEIKAISACVPKKIEYNSDLGYLIPAEEIDKTINSIGIAEKRIADLDVCSSDLCFRAAEILINDNNIDRNTIDALIFISQTPDYRQPATAMSLQHRLGLPKTTLSFDVNLACSGYIYGLSIASTFASSQGVNNVLLLVGETMSKTISRKDKVTTPLFGDAGTATFVSKVDNTNSLFSLNSDGGEADILRIPYGGYRNPSCEEGLKMVVDSEGNMKTGEELNMNGMDVFNFGLREVPRDITRILKETELSIQNIDLIIFHQANKFMTDFFAKKLRISLEKTPYSLAKFGNTSSASIPLTIVSEMFNNEQYKNREKVIVSGFGAGLSWASALVNLSNTKISKLIEY